ncbi:speckle targeted PIP5K1A-regulated poly(A) polymerase [Gastrophryne carolinensis]
MATAAGNGESSEESRDVQAGERGTFRCVLCGISVPNRPSLSDHLRGRRHTRLCEERDKRQQQQERSVFVSGFPKSTTEEQLKDVFQPISSVKNIVMDKDRGLYAIVEFENGDGVSLVLAEHDLSIEGQRLKVKPREKKEFKKKKGGPRVLQPPDPEALSKELIRCTNVEEQMKQVVTLCSPSHHEIRLRELLLSLLRETFTEFFPGCQLHPFGSSVNGFEISGCDLDLYLELGKPEESSEELNSEDERPEEECPGVKEEDATSEGDEGQTLDTRKGLGEDEAETQQHTMEDDSDEDENIAPGLSLQGLSNEEVLNLVERVLRQCVPGVHGVQTVPSARRPVIRFQHKTSGLRGDITLNNRLALRNSSYLRLCSDLDPRVSQLVYTVRYWARVNQLAGNPLGGGPLLNNYALTLLIFFFLQSRSPPVIPALSQLREVAAHENPQTIDGWDCTFPSDHTQVQASENQQSLGCLLSEFFSFFSTLDLRSSILCPRDGAILALPLNPPSPPWAEGFRPGHFNVQDPFELSHNVCSNVSSKMARRFSSKCTLAAKICRSPLYHLRSSSRPWGVVLLLLPSPSEGAKKEAAEISIPLAGCSLDEVFKAMKRVLVEVLLCSCEEENANGGGEMRVDEEEQPGAHLEGLSIGGDASEVKGEDLHEDGAGSRSSERKRESAEEMQSDRKRRKLESAEDDAGASRGAELAPKKGQQRKKQGGTKREPVMRVTVWHQVWEGRRKQRRGMAGQHVGKIALETAVSRVLSSGVVDGRVGTPLLQVTIKAQPTNEGSAKLTLTAEVDDYHSSANFFHFLKVFLPAMVPEILSV